MRKNPEYIALVLVILGIIIGMTFAYRSIPPVPNGQGTEKPSVPTAHAETDPQQTLNEIQAMISQERKEFCNRARKMQQMMLDGKGLIEKAYVPRSGWIFRNSKRKQGEIKERMEILNAELAEKLLDWCPEP